MKGFTKKIASVVIALTLVIGLATSASAAAWDSYFGQNAGWYEGALGNMAGVSATGFTARMEQIGWGGVWGCRVFQKINVTKGQTYAISFKAKSTKQNKHIYVKVGSDSALAHSFWVKLAKGKTQAVNVVFKAAATTKDEISFGLGGDYGDRSGVSTDGDANVRYAVFQKQFGQSAKGLMQLEPDSASATDIQVSNFSLVPAAKKISFKAKAKGKKKVKVTMKKAAGIKTFEVKVGKAKKKTTSTSVTVKAKKKGKQKVQVRGISADKTYKTKWATKKVKVK